MNNNATLADRSLDEHTSAHEFINSIDNTNVNRDRVDDESNSDSDEYALDAKEYSDDMDMSFALPTRVPTERYTNWNDKCNFECRVQEYVMQGIEDLSILNEKEDYLEKENVSNVNMYEGGNDDFTNESELLVQSVIIIYCVDGTGVRLPHGGLIPLSTMGTSRMVYGAW